MDDEAIRKRVQERPREIHTMAKPGPANHHRRAMLSQGWPSTSSRQPSRWSAACPEISSTRQTFWLMSLPGFGGTVREGWLVARVVRTNLGDVAHLGAALGVTHSTKLVPPTEDSMDAVSSSTGRKSSHLRSDELLGATGHEHRSLHGTQAGSSADR
jgi:hypothetical protein